VTTREAPDGPALRIVIADDQASVREGLVLLLGGLPGIEVAGAAADGEQALALVAEHRPDAILLDLHMPVLDGIEATRRLTDAGCPSRFLVLTTFDGVEQLYGALRAGAVGYLLKDMDPRDLPGALRGVLSGEGAVSPRMVMRIMDEFRGPTKRRFGRRSTAAARLSPREWEIMNLLSAGRSTEEVAQELFLSPTTVRVHVSTVLKKLRVKDRESAFRLLRDE
jgi:DNA-binding NarL/FixJ family response regulator